MVLTVENKGYYIVAKVPDKFPFAPVEPGPGAEFEELAYPGEKQICVVILKKGEVDVRPLGYVKYRLSLKRVDEVIAEELKYYYSFGEPQPNHNPLFKAKIYSNGTSTGPLKLARLPATVPPEEIRLYLANYNNLLNANTQRKG